MKALFVLIGLALVHSAAAQKMPSDYFEEGEAFVNSRDYQKAMAAYSYIVEHHKTYENYPEAFYNLAYTAWLAKDLTKAKGLFRAILEQDFNDKKRVGGNIMASPYANFHHQASRFLRESYYRQKKFDSALHFLQLADTVYSYNHFCGNAFAENDIDLALTYADLYGKLGQQEKAVSALLNVVFLDRLADNTTAIRRLKTLLRRRGIPLKATLDNSLKNLYTKPSATGEPHYYFQFLEREIKAPYAENEAPVSKEAVVKAVKKSIFYTELTAPAPSPSNKGTRKK